MWWFISYDAKVTILALSNWGIVFDLKDDLSLY
jgi:hypothetical protein